MEDIFHPVLNNKSIFKIYQSKDETFLYSILAPLYSQTIDRTLFNRPYVYTKYKKLVNIENISFPMKNEKIGRFTKQSQT